jgi:ribose transport system ATP-binding protein
MTLEHKSQANAGAIAFPGDRGNSPAESHPQAGTAPVLEMTGIHKSFPGVRALKNASIVLRAGEIHALLGENGAGKSTLIKVLSGAHHPDAGIIRLNGVETRIRSPHQARALGIAVIYQEFNLVPSLTVCENLFLGQEHARAGFIRFSSERQTARALFARLGLPIDPDALCRDLNVAQQQLVEIAKALYQKARVLVMDEPTAALSDREVEKLFAMVRELRAQGIATLYVTHRLNEVFALCDRATVMRDGEQIDTRPVRDLTRERLIELMVGRKLEAEFPKRSVRIGEPRLVARDLCRGTTVRGVSIEVRRGEVLGLTGLVGAGRTELARLLFGADPADAGTISLDGNTVRLRSPRDAIRAGICLLPEDRKQQGLVLGLSVRDNFALPSLPRLSRFGFIRDRIEANAFDRFVRGIRIKVSDDEQVARNLSGGNQQKLVLAKWLEANSELIIFDEPTRGVDVGAKFEIYQLINDLAAAGKAVLMISSELPEVLGMSDRIIVMREGRVTGQITDVAKATQEDILRLATLNS